MTKTLSLPKTALPCLKKFYFCPSRNFTPPFRGAPVALFLNKLLRSNNSKAPATGIFYTPVGGACGVVKNSATGIFYTPVGGACGVVKNSATGAFGVKEVVYTTSFQAPPLLRFLNRESPYGDSLRNNSRAPVGNYLQLNNFSTKNSRTPLRARVAGGVDFSREFLLSRNKIYTPAGPRSGGAPVKLRSNFTYGASGVNFIAAKVHPPGEILRFLTIFYGGCPPIFYPCNFSTQLKGWAGRGGLPKAIGKANALPLIESPRTGTLDLKRVVKSNLYPSPAKRGTHQATQSPNYSLRAIAGDTIAQPILNLLTQRNSSLAKTYKWIPMEYRLDSFQRSNQDTCITHKPAVSEGDWVQSGDILTDCASSVGGELSLGQNLLIAYLPWEGYNFEDAILISERLVIDDLYTSVHIERYEMEIHQTNLGPEEITRDIPDVSEAEVEKLDSFGIVKIGSWVEEGDILVGKITPIPKNTISPYQKLLYTILEKKVRPFRDSSLRAPKGVKAKVIDIKYFAKEFDFLTNHRLSLPSSPPSVKFTPPAPAALKKLLRRESPYGDSLRNNSRALDKKFKVNFLTAERILLRGGYGDCRESEVLAPRHFAKEGASRRVQNSALSAAVKVLTESNLFPKELLHPRRGRSNNPQRLLLSERSTPKTKKIKHAVLSKIRESPYGDSLSQILTNRASRASFTNIHASHSSSSHSGAQKSRVVLSHQKMPREVNQLLPREKLHKLHSPDVGRGGSANSTTNSVLQKKIKNLEYIHIYLAETRKIQVGDKMSGRHGNKGIVSQILPVQDMPYLPDGTPIDMVLNPLGVPSRMNVGQIYECLLGLAGRYLGENYKVSCFDEIYGPDASRSFVFNKLYEASTRGTGFKWLFDPNTPGKVRIYDGRTGDSFDQAVTVGHAYILRLVHMVDDKIHMRSTGPYSLVTQQPLRGRSKEGGQRLGEMEVWALEGYGAAFTLLEMLTIKSDDMTGRMTLWSNLILNKDISIGTPESFKVLICELQALCLDIGLFRNTMSRATGAFDGEANQFTSQLTEIDSLINLP